MRFGKLADGVQFSYNCFVWEKDTSLTEKVNDLGTFQGFFKNARVVNPSHLSHTAYFADHVEVKPIIKEEEK